MSNAEQLTTSWNNVFNGSQAAIDWITDTRTQSQRLDNEAEGLTLELRRLRNMAKRLGGSSSRPVTAGFFGLSQAGKSYLISALAADKDGKLQTEFDGRRIDFVEHLNPEGGGKEATGLVTRFSRRAEKGVDGYPLRLEIFSEVEIIKILTNAFFKDFDKEKLNYEIDQTLINDVLNKVKNKVGQRFSGLTEDDVVDLQDYATENFGKSVSSLNANYWAKATMLAPKLSIEDRAVLFSILWGGSRFPELTEIYIRFAKVLAKLGHPKTLFAPLSAVIKDVENGGISKADSIMNVDMVERLGTTRDEKINVCPQDENNIGAPIEITLSELTILTAELVFPLMNNTKVPAVEKIDLLDFPGYRGRMSLTEIKVENIAQLILRGKVAYLFERYTDSQEMNILIMCTPSNAQSEVNDVGPVLETWIKKTQGETPEIRSLRKPALLWAITKFDIRIQDKLGTTEENLKISWGRDGLLKQTILERFDKFSWVENWSNGQPFNNIFLVRKPGFKVPFLDVENGVEISINEKERKQLDLMKQTFSASEDVKTYVANPEAKWDAMLALNDGGMHYISDYLETISSPEVKHKRIIEQLHQAIANVEQRFSTWYQSDGDEEVAKKRALAQRIVSILQPRAILFGEMLKSFELPQETLFDLYHAVDFDEKEENTAASSESNNGFDFGFGDVGGFNLFDEPNFETTETAKNVEELIHSPYAQNVFKAWIEHLRAVSNNEKLIRFFQLNADSQSVFDDIANELITAATRLKLQEQLAKAVIHNEQAGYKRDQVVERQVFTAHIHIADFLAWLGFVNQPISERPASRAVAGKVIFEQSAVPNKLPVLDNQTSNFMQRYIYDWFVAFGAICEQNAGHSAGREIDATQNAKLGEVLRQFTSSRVKGE